MELSTTQTLIRDLFSFQPKIQKKMCFFLIKKSIVEIFVEISTPGRYISEWDPREAAHTKGGYLEGYIELPASHTDNNLR